MIKHCLIALIFVVIITSCGGPEVVDINATTTTERRQTLTVEAYTPTPQDTATPTLDPLITPSPTPCTPNSTWTDTYTVQPNDTLGSIAIAAGITILDLQAGNCIEDRDLLRVGDVLRVPNRIAIDISASPQGLEGAIIFLYRDNDTTGYDLWTVKVDGSALKQLTERGGIIGRPVRSPNREQVAYREVSVFHDPEEANSPTDIWLIQADGTRQTVLAEQGPNDNLRRSEPTWSNDNEVIYYTEQVNQRGSLVKINVDGTNRQVLFSGDFIDPQQQKLIPPAISPDDQFLAFISFDNGNPTLYMLDLETLSLSIIDSDFNFVRGLYWVPSDGLAGIPVLAYQVNRDGQQIWNLYEPNDDVVTSKDSRLSLVSPDLFWRIRILDNRFQLIGGDDIPNASPLPNNLDNLSWGTTSGEYVYITDNGHMQIININRNVSVALVSDGESLYPAWTPQLWVVLP